MFSQVSVSHSVHREGVSQTPPGLDLPRDRNPPWAGPLPGQGPPGQTPVSRRATAADGMHPTGMHSV